MALPPLANGLNKEPSFNWAPILGRWKITERGQTFRGEGHEAIANGQRFAMGLAVSNAVLQDGVSQVKVQFSSPFDNGEQAGGIVVGYRSPEQHYIFAELGADRHQYSVGEYVSGFGWRPLVSVGERENLQDKCDYLIKVAISGQELKMSVDGVPVVQQLLSQPLEGRQVGLIAAGTREVLFSDFTVERESPRAFVAMHFAEPYDTLYRDVIHKQARKSGFEVIQMSDKAGPGIVLQDMQREIRRAQIVIAEITPANANVFYEVGYAQALGKPTILLAQRGVELPFDIRSFRVIFYNDTIGGKAEVERNLENHLQAITGS